MFLQPNMGLMVCLHQVPDLPAYYTLIDASRVLHLQEIKTHEFGIYKKKVAQLMTVAREKEMAELGIGDDAPSLRDRRRQEKCGPLHAVLHIICQSACIQAGAVYMQAAAVLSSAYPRC